jgi:4-hydroxy-tetrahydrodipicolinate reductase
MSRIRVVSYGLGPIGLAAAGLALQKRGLELVGAVDIDPSKAGKTLAELLGDGARGGEASRIVVEADAEAVLARSQPDAILHCTSSFLPAIKDQLLQAVRAGIDVVSSAEELLLPDLQNPEIAAELDAAARAGSATIVGTGVNPGFVLDYMAIVASGVCGEVRRVRGVRVVDAGTRRLPLQRKVGASLTAAEFAEQQRTGKFGHIGMRESVALIGRGLELELDAIEQTLEPVLAEAPQQTRFLRVEAGQVAGLHNVGRGLRAGEVVVELDLSMYVGAPDPCDEVWIDGDPNVHLRLEGGVPGDSATAAILVNTLQQAVGAAPGLRTILDLPTPRRLR